MSTSFDQAITANIIPDVAIASSHLPVPTKKPTTAKNPEHPLLILIPLIPFIFLLAIAALLLSKLIKSGLQQWIAPRKTSIASVQMYDIS